MKCRRTRTVRVSTDLRTPLRSPRPTLPTPPPLAGFSLLELLVVIGIVAVLATLAFPALASAKSRAQRVHCAGNLRQIALAARLYAEDHDDRLPIPTAATGPATSQAGFLPDLLRDQLKDAASFQCRRDTRPEETRRTRGSYEGNPAHANRSLRRLAAERSAATNAQEPWWYRDLQPWHQGRNTVRADGSVRLEP